MDLLTLIVVLAVVGFALYLITNYVPMPTPMRQAIIVIVVIVLIVWVARALLGGSGPRL